MGEGECARPPSSGGGEMALNKVGSLFNAGAAYAAFRPSYVPEIYEEIAHFGCGGSNALLYDLGCGTGQVEKALHNAFEHIVAVDTSQKQLDAAPELDGVEYRLDFAEDALEKAQPQSVDLVTCAQAAHWFENPDRFARALKQALKPTGALALWGYTLPCFVDNGHDPASPRYASDDDTAPRTARANAAILAFHDDTLRDYWEQPGRSRVMSKCEHLLPTLRAHFSCTALDEVYEVKPCIPFSAFANYVDTWSGYNTFRRLHPDDAAREYDALCSTLRALLVPDAGDGNVRAADDATPCNADMVVPYFLILCK